MLTFKNVVFYILIISKFVLLRKFGNIVYDIARKYDSYVTVADLRKNEKLHLKVKKADLDINFLTNCKTFNVIPKFLCFDLPYGDSNEKLKIRKRLLKSTLNKRIKERNQLINKRDKK